VSRPGRAAGRHGMGHRRADREQSSQRRLFPAAHPSHLVSHARAGLARGTLPGLARHVAVAACASARNRRDEHCCRRVCGNAVQPAVLGRRGGRPGVPAMNPSLLDSMLIMLTPGLPLALVLTWCVPALRSATGCMLPWAPVPALLLAL